MKRILCLIFFLLCISFNNIYGQKMGSKFSVNINLKIGYSKLFKRNKSTKISIVETKVYDDDSLVFTNNSRLNIKCKLIKDTLNMFAYLSNDSESFVFILNIFKDEFKLIPINEQRILFYKNSQSDSLFEFSFELPSQNKSLILAKRPTYKIGEIIEGYIEFTSKEYFVASNGGEKKRRRQLKAYFKTVVN